MTGDEWKQPKKTTRQLSEEALSDLLANMEIMETSIAPIAKLYYKRYAELMEAGFDEKQAFTIVLNRGLE